MAINVYWTNSVHVQNENIRREGYFVEIKEINLSTKRLTGKFQKPSHVEQKIDKNNGVRWSETPKWPMEDVPNLAILRTRSKGHDKKLFCKF